MNAGRHTVPVKRTMTGRARWYLKIAAIRHLLIAGLAVFVPWSFTSPNYDAIKDTADLWVWGVLFAGAGVACATGAVTRSPRIARLGLMWSATSTLMAAVGFALALMEADGFLAPIGTIMFSTVAAKDFIVCADPLRSPFEEWIEEVIDDERKRTKRGR